MKRMIYCKGYDAIELKYICACIALWIYKQLLAVSMNDNVGEQKQIKIIKPTICAKAGNIKDNCGRIVEDISLSQVFIQFLLLWLLMQSQVVG